MSSTLTLTCYAPELDARDNLNESLPEDAHSGDFPAKDGVTRSSDLARRGRPARSEGLEVEGRSHARRPYGRLPCANL